MCVCVLNMKVDKCHKNGFHHVRTNHYHGFATNPKDCQVLSLSDWFQPHFLGFLDSSDGLANPVKSATAAFQSVARLLPFLGVWIPDIFPAGIWGWDLHGFQILRNFARKNKG